MALVAPPQMGTACDMVSNPGGAILCGMLAGAPPSHDIELP